MIDKTNVVDVEFTDVTPDITPDVATVDVISAANINTPLTVEEKLSIRDAQVNLATVKDQAAQQIQKAEQILQMTIQQLAIDRKIPFDNSVDFNFGTLAFVKK